MSWFHAIYLRKDHNHYYAYDYSTQNINKLNAECGKISPLTKNKLYRFHVLQSTGDKLRDVCKMNPYFKKFKELPFNKFFEI